jgi:hypothetical protein
MTALRLNDKLIIVAIFLLTGTAVAEVPVLYPMQETATYKKVAANHHAVHPALQWELLPGESILQIARLMFPKDSIARSKFIRAVIHTNPEHFPAGTYQPLTAGTVIHIPDLRSIHAYSVPILRKHEQNTANSTIQNKSSTETITSGLNSNPLLLQLLTQLEQVAESETRALNTLTKHTESLVSQIAAIQSIHEIKAQEPSTATGPLQQTSRQYPENAASLTESSDVSWESPLTFDIAFMLGILLTILIIILILRNFHRIQEKLTQRSNAALSPTVTHHHQYEALFLDHNRAGNNPLENSYGASSEMASQARLIIKQGDSENAIQFLQKQLSTNKFDISGWLLLFELLYSLNNRPDFKKNARRFKRLGKFPDIWAQIQELGYRLEPNEPLYFDDQKRKEKFFSNSSNSENNQFLNY